MILSRAKPAIGGDKQEEKGGSAGRKQVTYIRGFEKHNKSDFKKHKIIFGCIYPILFKTDFKFKG